MKFTKLAILMTLSFTSNLATAGREGGGGDTASAEFVLWGHYMLSTVQKEQSLSNPDFSGISLRKLKASLRTTSVQSRPSKCLELDMDSGKDCLEARYQADQNLIEFSRIAWKKTSCIGRLALTLHEYGRASGIENSNYQYSALLLRSREAENLCRQLANGVPPSETQRKPRPSVYQPGTPISVSRIAGLKVLGAYGQAANEAEVIAFSNEITGLRALDSIVETREGFIEMYSGSTLVRALRLNNGTLEVVYPSKGFAPESAHFSLGERDEHSVSSLLTFGFKSCSDSADGSLAGAAGEGSCQHLTIVLELIGTANN